MNTRETWWSLIVEAARSVAGVVDGVVNRVAPLDVRDEAHRRALVDIEELIEVFEPLSEIEWLGHDVSAASAGGGAGPGAVEAPAPAPGFPTSELLIAAANQLELRATGAGFVRGDYLRELIADLRDRAELLAAMDD